MKKLFLLIPLLLLTGCKLSDNTANTAEETKTYKGFVTLCSHNDSRLTFMRDPYTDNIYIRYYEHHGYGGGGSFGPYYNSEGQIMKYQEFLEVHRH